ncbi:MAG TPA: glycosyltransferase, partial [Pirellulales bacterium]|nr:glycosyltransferase [Pirellulales bacterium]
MHVLIADFDLFRTVGGGQTFYRAVIEKNPQIEFSYLIVNEAPGSPRPANARAIRCEPHYVERQWTDYCDLVPPRWCLPAFLLASNIAFSVRGRSFDVVDLPDYKQLGYFLPAALAHHHADVKRVALSMHGVISTTISMNWASDGALPQEAVRQEEMQYQAADLRYGLSADYLDEWRTRFALASHYLCPLRFLGSYLPVRSAESADPPDLNFVGRTEKRKGPDVFAELCWWLPPALYGRARIIGPPSDDLFGTSSEQHLHDYLRRRPGEKAIELCPAATSDELRRRFAARSVTVLPSRYDTFNLVAVESLFSGCPTTIGDGAGVCRFLDEYFPDVPYIKLDMDRPLASLPELESVLADYDRYRGRLVDALAAAAPSARGPSLAEIYGSPPSFSQDVRREAAAWYQRMIEHACRTPTGTIGLKESARRLVRKHTSPQFRAGVRSLHPRRLAAACKTAVGKRLAPRRAPPSRGLEMRGRAIAARYHAVAWMPERTTAELSEKWRQCSQLVVDLRIDRARLWRELARIESLRGNDLLAATYRLRAMRLTGIDHHSDLPTVMQTLGENGFHREAEAAAAMYDGQPDGQARCRELLDRAARDHRCPAGAEYEVIDDRRGPRTYRASVIVSLYKAAANLPLFLDTLSLQTLLRTRQAEIVLIDSGSPEDEYRVFRQWADRTGTPAVYARSKHRETIQAAWNRGIGLSRGQYLSFLGVDEAMLPNALEVLADELDADLQVDWVQANSLVTRVNERGHWVSDVMTYDRSGYAQRLVYLETCYLSYVGAMYRRTIHERLGYYDASFGAAGDTEFKNRVL